MAEPRFLLVRLGSPGDIVHALREYFVMNPGGGWRPLMAALRRAKCVVSADTGPLHLASALKTPVVGLFGPTDPARNGPYSTDDVVVRNPQFGETTYRRGASYSPAMLSISVDQVVEAVQRRLGLRS
jgi:heptosyltransferase-1